MQEIKVGNSGGIILLGKQGENLARRVLFDLTRWISTFGPGTAQLLHQRSGDETPYPVAVEQDGTLAIWKVSSADTASAGTGRTELQYYVGDTLAKSETWMTKVLPALGDASEMPPEAQQGWVDQVLQAGAAAVEAAEKAENAAVRQPYPNVETGTWWVWDAESGAYTDTGVSYGTGGGGGTSDHDKLLGRDKAEQHPISAITGLEDALAGKQPTGSYITEETDPTVPAWAKAETKPSYTADEVGALSSETLPEAINTALAQAKESGEFDGADGQPGADGKSAYQYAVEGGYTGTEEAFAAKLAEEIPTALPNPNSLTFTGAVSGSYDGSEPLTVEIPSGGSGGGGISAFEKIGTIDLSTIAEGYLGVEFTVTDVTEIVLIWTRITNTTTSNSSLLLAFNSGNYYNTLGPRTGKAGYPINGYTYIKVLENVGILSIVSAGAISNTNYTQGGSPCTYNLIPVKEKIQKISIKQPTTQYYADAGIVEVYVR